MRRRNKKGQMFLLLLATVLLLAALSQLLPALQKEEIQSNPLLLFSTDGRNGPAAEGGNENPSASASESGAASYEVELDQLTYYTVEVAGKGEEEPSYFAGFSNGEKALASWLAAASSAGREGKLVQKSFPEGRLQRPGEVPSYLSELMLLCNQQIRHLRRGADFFGSSWEEIETQNTTWKRLDLLLEEGRECRRQMAGLGAYYQSLKDIQAFGSLETGWAQWIERLEELKQNKDGRSFWLAQQQALAVVNLWRQLLWDVGFV
ncbi:MAG: hypothetical protein AAGU12_07080 [Clostridiales bacterium]